MSQYTPKERSTIAGKTLFDGRVAVDITPEAIAELFCELDSAGQAAFFNHVDAIASCWQGPFCFQLQAITDEDGLTLAGRRVMQHIGEYSHWGLVPHMNEGFI